MADGNTNRQYQGFSYPSAPATAAGGVGGLPMGGMPYYGVGTGAASSSGLVRRSNAAAGAGAVPPSASSAASGGGYGYFYRTPSSAGGHSGFAGGSDAGSSHGQRAGHQRPAPAATTVAVVPAAAAQNLSPASSSQHAASVHVRGESGAYPALPSVAVDTHSNGSSSFLNRPPAGGAAPWGHNCDQHRPRHPQRSSSTSISFLPPSTSAAQDAAMLAEEDGIAVVSIGGAGAPFSPVKPTAFLPTARDGVSPAPKPQSSTSAAVSGGGYFGAVPMQTLSEPRPSSPASAPAAASKGFFRDMMNHLLSDLGDTPDEATAGAGGNAEEPRPLHQTRFGCPEDDLPLLEELGIFPGHIWRKAKAVLNPFKPMPIESVEDTDLAGPLVFAVALAFLLSLQGKIQFSAIYGLSVLGVILFKVLLTLMHGSGSGSGGRPGAPLQFIISSLGYALLPSLVLALLRTVQFWVAGNHSQLLLPLAFLVIGWSSWCATSLLVRGLTMEPQRFLILYPMVLFYSLFAALTIF